MSIIPSFLTHPPRERETKRERERKRKQERTYPSYLTTWVMLHTPSVPRWLQLDTWFGFECIKGVREAWSLNRSCYFNRINGIFEVLLSLWFSGVRIASTHEEVKPFAHLAGRRRAVDTQVCVIWLCDGTGGQSTFIFGCTQDNGSAEDTGSQALLCQPGAQTPGILYLPHSFPS